MLSTPQDRARAKAIERCENSIAFRNAATPEAKSRLLLRVSMQYPVHICCQNHSSINRLSAANVQRAKKAIKAIKRDRAAITRQRKIYTSKLSALLTSAGKDIAGQVSKAMKNLNRSAGSDEAQKILDQLNFEGWVDFIQPSEDVLLAVFKDGVAEAFSQIGFKPSETIIGAMNGRAVQYAEKRAAELVGMKNIGTTEDPHWIENPDRSWAITDTTRNNLRKVITDAIENGTSPQALEAEIADNFSFSSERAERIARTELAMADVDANMTAYRASGVVYGKEWILGSEHTSDDDECDENAKAGIIPLDELFPSGDDAPPLHVNCCCDVVPVVMDSEGSEEG